MLRHARRGLHPLRQSRPEWRVRSRWYLHRRLLARIALQGTASPHSILLDCNRGHGSHRRHCPCCYIQGRLSIAYGSLKESSWNNCSGCGCCLEPTQPCFSHCRPAILLVDTLQSLSELQVLLSPAQLDQACTAGFAIKNVLAVHGLSVDKRDLRCHWPKGPVQCCQQECDSNERHHRKDGAGRTKKLTWVLRLCGGPDGEAPAAVPVPSAYSGGLLTATLLCPLPSMLGGRKPLP